MMITNYRFNKEVIKPNDIFYAEHEGFNKEKTGHYFFCIYAQEEDKGNGLFRDIIGLMITTKDAQGYTAKVVINGKDAVVCCDRPFRFVSDTLYVQNKYIHLSKKELQGIHKKYASFVKESLKQLKRWKKLK